ncbi:MAG: LOG family protein, partial [Deltaproteobacteria bacterium]|nr:LOG family protein [Deltaproteobacteria bacterium]
YRASDVDPERLESSFAMAKRAAGELLHGLVATQGDHPGVVICGGARLKMEDPRHREDCELAIRAGESVAREGFSVHTGGGMGVMHYAAVGGRNEQERNPNAPRVLGSRISLPFETVDSPCLDLVSRHDYFFTRKAVMFKNAAGAMILPGGMGTLDEYFDALRFASTSKEPFPAPLVGEIWRPLHHWLKEHADGPGQRGYISKEALDRIQLFTGRYAEIEATEYIKAESAQRVARFHRNHAAGNHGPLVHDIFGSESDLLRHPEFYRADVTMVWDFLEDMFSTFRFLHGRQGPAIGVIGSSQATTEDAHLHFADRLGSEIGALGLHMLAAQDSGLMALAGLAARTFKSSETSVAFLDRAGNSFGPDTHLCVMDPVRRAGFLKGTYGAVVMPGGIGTIDTACETQNLINCGKIDYSLVFAGTKYWTPFKEALQGIAQRWGYLSEREVAKMQITDDPSVAISASILHSKRFGRAVMESQRRIPLPVLSPDVFSA